MSHRDSFKKQRCRQSSNGSVSIPDIHHLRYAPPFAESRKSWTRCRPRNLAKPCTGRFRPSYFAWVVVKRCFFFDCFRPSELAGCANEPRSSE